MAILMGSKPRFACLLLTFFVMAAVAGAAEPARESDTAEQTNRDVLAEVRSWKSGAVTPPPTEFRAGHVSPKTETEVTLSQRNNGFTITLPSGTPIPTPTIHAGKLYASGGFHSREYYCFDAASAKLLWAVDLDDDGPTAAVAAEGVIAFNTESCTIFVLDASSGKMLWSWFLGDPLTTTPTISSGRLFTAYPAEAQYVEEQAAPADATPASEVPDKLPPTHVLACFELKTGKILWQRWIDGDALSSPVAVDNELYVTSSSGAIYRFDQASGEVLDARYVRATSAPVIVKSDVFYTRRADFAQGNRAAEALVKVDRSLTPERFVAVRTEAPHLDVVVQSNSKFHDESQALGGSNGIGGGGFGGGGVFNVAEESEKSNSADGQQADQQLSAGTEDEQAPVVVAEQESRSPVAENLGLDNVSGLQCFQGSRGLNAFHRNYNCIGDKLYCTDATTGRLLWSHKLPGELKQEGGFLAAPAAAAGGHIFVATLLGEVLEIEPTRGTILHRYATGARLRSQPIIMVGRIYVGTQEGTIVCIDTKNKALTGWAAWGGDMAHSAVSQDQLPPSPALKTQATTSRFPPRFPRLRRIRRWRLRGRN